MFAVEMATTRTHFVSGAWEIGWTCLEGVEVSAEIRNKHGADCSVDVEANKNVVFFKSSNPRKCHPAHEFKKTRA